MTQEDKDLYEDIKNGLVPFVELADMPLVNHLEINPDGMVEISRILPIKTESTRSLRDIIDRLKPDTLLYILPKSESQVFWGRGPVLTDPTTFAPIRPFNIRVARVRVNQYESTKQYNKFNKIVKQKEIQTEVKLDRKLLLIG